jgi:hypothetical protein
LIKSRKALKDIRGKLKMKTIKTTTFLGTAIVILSSFILLVSCTSGMGTVTDGLQQTNTSETNTSSRTTTATTTETATPTTTTTTATTTTQNTTTAQTTTAPTSTTPTTATTTTTTTTITTTTVEPENVFIPVVGAEVSNWVITYDYDRWTVLQFDYDIIHELGTDYHFPWSLTIKNKTETDLELTAYIIHWGYHNWIGYISKMPFVLKAGETKNLSGEDIMTDTFFEDMVYYEDVQIEVYIVEG